jgi:hypothetical protein
MATYTLPVITTGDAGSADGEYLTGFAVRGFIAGIRVDYHADAPATTDLVVSEVGGLNQVILTLADQKTDGIWYPERDVHGDDGVAIASASALYYIDGQLSVSIAQCDALAPAATVTVQVIEDRP